MAGPKLKNIDLNLLVVFEAIYTACNISHAADQLAMSQPAVSNALARLRDLMDDPLFVRAKRGVAPTLKAKRIIGPVREALKLIGRQLETETDIDLGSYKRLFRIVMADVIEPIMMPPVLRVIDQRAPDITVECVPAFRTDIIDEIRAGTLDIACFAYPLATQDIVVVPICPVDLMVVARIGHPAIRGTLNLETFKALGHIALVPELRPTTNVDRDMTAHEISRRVVYTVNKLWSIPPIVERTDLIALLPRWFGHEIARNFRIAMHEIPVKMSDQYIYMMWNAKNNDDAGHKWLRETMLSAVRNRSGNPDNVTHLPTKRAGDLRSKSSGEGSRNIVKR